MHVVGHAKGEAGAAGDSRCTPPVIWTAARAALTAATGAAVWDLDPATNPASTVPAHVRWYGHGPADDGLLLPWHGHVWLNWPFSASARWVRKACREATRRAESVTALGPGDTSTSWWRALARACDAWAVWPRREHFPAPGERGEGRPAGGVHLFWLCRGDRGRAERWSRAMRDAGALPFPPAR